MSDLRAIVYVSSAVKVLDAAEIARLLSVARARNLAAQVTGVLLYADGSFMQYIEGPRRMLDAIYPCIVADPRHTLLNELVDEPIQAREFADWSMSYNPATLPDFLRPQELQWQEWRAGTRLGSGKSILRKVWKGRSP